MRREFDDSARLTILSKEPTCVEFEDNGVERKSACVRNTNVCPTGVRPHDLLQGIDLLLPRGYFSKRRYPDIFGTRCGIHD